MAEFYTNNPQRVVDSFSTHNPSIMQVVYHGILKVWNGLSWTTKTLKVKSDTFIGKPVKRWDGNNWLLIKSM